MNIGNVLEKHAILKEMRLSGLSKELKLKIISTLLEYENVRKEFDGLVLDFINKTESEEFKYLKNKEDKSDEDIKRMNELGNSYGIKYQDFIHKLVSKNRPVKDIIFTFDEYSEIVDSNSDKDVILNESKLTPIEYLLLVYNLFCEE